MGVQVSTFAQEPLKVPSYSSCSSGPLYKSYFDETGSGSKVMPQGRECVDVYQMKWRRKPTYKRNKIKKNQLFCVSNSRIQVIAATVDVGFIKDPGAKFGPSEKPKMSSPGLRLQRRLAASKYLVIKLSFILVASFFISMALVNRPKSVSDFQLPKRQVCRSVGCFPSD